MKKIIYVLLSVFLLTVSCSKDDDMDAESILLDADRDGVIDSEDDCPNVAGLEALNGCPEEVDIWGVNKSNQRALDVVFFKPTDYQADDALIEDVSEVMLYIQSWYEKQMDLQGFGKKTFGLITNQNEEVRIHLVEGKQASSSYDGHSEIVAEINDYFAANSGFKQGSHLFVLGSSGSGVPFYGIGKTAFATSTNFKLVTTGQQLGDLELMKCDKLGGIMHELGHGLNLPHCAHKASDLPKIALMSFGNHTYQDNGKVNLVFLTKSDCAILDVNEVFNSKDKTFYDVSPKIEMQSYTVTKDVTKKATIIQGIFTSNVRATHLYVGHNGYPLSGGYDNITFATSVTPTANPDEYSFHVEMPYSDIFNGYQAKDLLELSIVVITENGNKRTPVKYDYTIDVLSPEPNNDILKDYTPHAYSDRSAWTITANSTTTNAERVASKMIDGDVESYWHSAWPYAIITSGFHVIEVDMSDVKTFNGLYIVSSRSGGQYRPKSISFQTSTDGTIWTVVKEVSLATIGSAAEINIDFENEISTEYLKIVVDQVFASNGTEDNLIINELDIY